MRRSYTLQPNEKYFFTVGSSDVNLILRDSTSNIRLCSDHFKNEMELSKSDIIEVNTIQNKTLWFFNHTKKPIYFEFQLVEIRTFIKNQNIDNGEIVISEISNSITVSEVQLPVNIANFPKVQTVSPQKKYMMVAKNIILGEELHKIESNESRESILIQAHYNNDGPISVSGFLLIAGGYINLSVQNEIFVSGALNSGFSYSEVINQ